VRNACPGDERSHDVRRARVEFTELVERDEHEQTLGKFWVSRLSFTLGLPQGTRLPLAVADWPQAVEVKQYYFLAENRDRE
jgi:hypothetical protein